MYIHHVSKKRKRTIHLLLSYASVFCCQGPALVAKCEVKPKTGDQGNEKRNEPRPENFRDAKLAVRREALLQEWNRSTHSPSSGGTGMGA